MEREDPAELLQSIDPRVSMEPVRMVPMDGHGRRGAFAWIFRAVLLGRVVSRVQKNRTSRTEYRLPYNYKELM
jgi:hypothetical protein